ncbi:MAG: helix-turn-helix transcriptional regulator [Dysgonamonadaceae bacterium]|jgi:transcriptional regulator with XRE-family HTH domain|nr:helix-turn-helix transcriptional regulator [Dysgonamonadaceae bacterium]
MLRIKEICKEQGITLQMLAERLGINYQSVYSLMSGNPKLSTLKRVSDCLNVPIVELFEEKKEIHFLLEFGGEVKKITDKDLIKLFNEN